MTPPALRSDQFGPQNHVQTCLGEQPCPRKQSLDVVANCNYKFGAI